MYKFQFILSLEINVKHNPHKKTDLYYEITSVLNKKITNFYFRMHDIQ